MSEVTGPSAINSILQNAHQEIQGFQSQKNPSSSETKQFISSMKEAASGLANASTHKMSAKVYGKLDGKTLQGLTQALSQLGIHQNVRSGSRVNWGNVLLSLQDLVKKMEKRKKDAHILRKGKKVEKYEVVEFLNSTEKEFSRFIVLLKERDADDETLLEFIIELMRRMEVLGSILEMAKTRKLSIKVDKKFYKKILKYILQIQKSGEIKQFIFETGSKGKSGNSHLRFWKALKQFRSLVNEMEHLSI